MDESKYFRCIFVIFVALIASSSLATGQYYYPDNYGIESRQNPTVRPIGTTAPTARPIGTTAGGVRPIGTTGGPTVRPIGTTKSSGGIDAGITVEISTPKTTPSNIISSITTKPVQQPTTQRPGVSVTVSVGPPKPTTPSTKPTTAIIPPAQCPLVNIMAFKTGFYQIATDPCSYVSCARTDNILFCANVKCDPGTAYSPQSARCIQSNQCAVKPK